MATPPVLIGIEQQSSSDSAARRDFSSADCSASAESQPGAAASGPAATSCASGAPGAELPPAAADPRPEAVQRASKLLGRRLKVEIRDGRVLEGDFHCLDKQGTVVLTNAQQLAEEGGDAGSKQQQMGMVLVPRAQQASCKLLVMPGESATMQALLSLDTA